MALSVITGATGNKTVTTGTTFTIGLASTAGDAVLVFVGIPSASVTVSSITDTNGNVYRLLGAITNGALRIEMWGTPKAPTLATGGTITVTLSATGTTAAGGAESYRGVAFLGTNTGTNTGSTSPITTGAQTLQEATSGAWLWMAGGQASTNGFTVSSGQIRRAMTATGVSTLLMDSNGNASPATDSATMTATTWGVVFGQLRGLVATADTLTMSEKVILGIGNAVADTLTMSDSVTVQLQTPLSLPLYDGISNIADNFGASTLDQNWTQMGGASGNSDTIKLTGGGAVTTVGTAWGNLMYAGSGINQNNQYIQAKVAALGTGDNVEVWSRMSGSHDNITGYNIVYSKSGFIQLYRVINSVVTLLTQTAITPTVGDIFAVDVVQLDGGNVHVSVGVNGILEISGTDSAGTVPGGQVGLGILNASGTAQLSNFYAGDFFEDHPFSIAQLQTESLSDTLALSDAFAKQLLVPATPITETLSDTLAFSDAIIAAIQLSEVLADGISNIGDTFSGKALDQNWTQMGGASGNSDTIKLTGTGAITTVGTAWGNLLYAGSGIGPDQYAQMQLSATGGSHNNIEVWVRLSGTFNSLSGYNLVYSAVGNIQLIEVSNSVNNVLATLAITPTVGDIIRLEIVGSTLSVYLNGLLFLNWTDTTHASGQPGLGLYNQDGGVQADNFMAGALNQDSIQTNWFNLQLADTLQATGGSSPFSDNFWEQVLDPRWSYNTQGAAEAAPSGGQLVITTNATAEDIFNTTYTGQMLQQPFTDTGQAVDLTIKIANVGNQGNTSIGFLIEQTAASTWAIFFIGRDSGNTKSYLYFANTSGGVSGTAIRNDFAAPVLSPSVTTVWLRLVRAANGSNTVSTYYSTDGVNFTLFATGVFYLQFNKVGVFVTNSATATVVNCTLDDFINNFSPIDVTVTGTKDAALVKLLTPIVAADTLTMSDQLTRIGYGDLIAEQLVLADAFVKVLSGGNVIPEVLTDALTLSDALLLGYGNALTDSLTLSDAQLLGYGFLISDTITLTDSIALSMVLSETLTDTLVLSDAIAIGYGNALSDQITLTDSLVVLFTMGSGLSDTMTITDSQLLGYGFLISDSLTLTDNAVVSLIAALLTEVLADTLTITDAMLLGYGFLIADTLTLTDSLALRFSIAETFTDTLTLTDSMALGYGDVLSDTMTMSDSLAALLGSGASLSDSLVLSDSLLLGYGLAINDTLVLTDNVSVSLLASLLTEVLADTLTITDSMRLGVGFLIADQLVFTDAAILTLSEGSSFSDTLTLTDSMSLGYGFAIADQLTWTDSIIALLGIVEVLSDSFPAASEQVRIGYGNVIQETLTITDSLLLGYGLLVSDQMSLSDSIQINSGAALIQQQLQDTLVLTDQLTRIGYGNLIAEQMVLSEQMLLGYGNLLKDQLTLTDSVVASLGIPEAFTDTLTLSEQLRIGYGLAVPFCAQPVYSDSFSPDANPLNPTNWQTATGFAACQATGGVAEATSIIDNCLSVFIGTAVPNNQYAQATLAIVPANGSAAAAGIGVLVDTAGNTGYVYTIVDNGDGTQELDVTRFGDFVTIFTGSVVASVGDVLKIAVADGLVYVYYNGQRLATIADSTYSSGDPAIFFGVANTTADTALSNFVTGSPCFEALSMSDSLAVGYGNVIADTLTLSDALSALFTMGSNLSDTLTLTDSSRLGYGFLIADQLTLTDSFAFTVGGTQQTENLSDTLILSDSLVIGYGLVITDQIVLSDAFALNAGAALISEVFTDALLLSDAIMLGYGNSVVDQLLLTEAMALGYGNALFDVVVIADAVVVILGLQETFADQMVLSDRVVIGFGSGITDTLTQTDSMLLGYGLVITEQLVLADSFALNSGAALIQQNLQDQLSLTDALVAGYGNAVTEQLVFADSTSLGYGDLLADVLSMSDSIIAQLAIAEMLADTLTMADSEKIGYGNAITDSLTLADAAIISYGYIPGESLLIVDYVSVGYGDLLSDSMNVMADAFSFAIVLPGLTLAVSDQISTMVDSTQVGYGNQLHDSSAMTDQMQMLESFQLALQDATPAMLDALQTLMFYGLQVNEAMVFQDQLAILYGLIISDPLTLSDQLDKNLISVTALLLADTGAANWFDAILLTMVFAPGEIVMASLSVILEMIAKQIQANGQQVITNVSAQGQGVAQDVNAEPEQNVESLSAEVQGL